MFLAVAGLAASVIVDLPNWNWWGFSGTYTLDKSGRFHADVDVRRFRNRKSRQAPRPRGRLRVEFLVSNGSAHCRHVERP